MHRIIAEITVSLDGYCAGPDISEREPMGRDGEMLHRWIFEGRSVEEERLLNESMSRVGAVLVGRRTYDLAIETGWGGENPFHTTAFVISHRPVSKTVPGFVYITDGAETAVARAKEAAGGKDIWLMGGAELIRYFLAAGLVDELYIHIAPVLLGGGLRLFDKMGSGHIELEHISSIQTVSGQHLRYRVKK